MRPKNEFKELARTCRNQHARANRQATVATHTEQLECKAAVCTNELRDEPIVNELRRS